MILPAQTIRSLCVPVDDPLIEPFKERYTFAGVTGGLSPAGYDICLDQDITLYPVTLWNLFCRRKSFTLASSFERFNVPADLIFTVMDKSSWARRGLTVQNTVAEPGWSGFLTLELCNHGDTVLKLKRCTPIAQVQFRRLEAPTDQPYDGRYNKQKQGPQPAINVTGIRVL